MSTASVTAGGPAHDRRAFRIDRRSALPVAVKPAAARRALPWIASAAQSDMATDVQAGAR
jgi:hypothetical protein